jgi:HEAT repeat protein
VLVAALKDASPEVRQRAAEALAKPPAPSGAAGASHAAAADAKPPEAPWQSIVDALTAALKDENASVRAKAATTLVTYAQDAKSSAHALVAALKDANSIVRRKAAEALYHTGADKSFAPALLAALDENGPQGFAGVMRALGQMGPDAKQAVPQLLAAVQDEDSWVRYAAADALGNILAGGAAGASPAVPNIKAIVAALIPLLKDPEPQLPVIAIDALGKIGPPSADAVPALIESLKARRYDIRRKAAETLGLIGEPAKAAIPGLTALLKDEYHDVSDKAVEALSKMGPAALGGLTDALKDRKSVV